MSTPTTRRSSLPTAVRIALLYLGARVVTTGFFLIAAVAAGPESRFGANPDLGALLGGWDAQWYGYIAAAGYPSELPRDPSGAVGENAWAFMPIYAYLAAWVGALLGGWVAGAVAVSVISGYLCCVVLYGMLRDRLDASGAMFAVLLFAVGPVAALFQVGYAESLFLLWLLLALRAVILRRFGWLFLLIPLMGYTRPGVLAFALFLGLYGLVRWFTRRTDPLPIRQAAGVIAAGVWACIVGFSWQVIAALITGVPNAYLDTEMAWRRAWGQAENGFVPFTGFIRAWSMWFELWGLPGPLGVVTLIILVVAVGVLLWRGAAVRRLGVEIRLWSASYLVYLLAVFFPQSSLFRLLFPLSPLWGAMAGSPSKLRRAILVAACLTAQGFWVFFMYARGNEYWQIP